METIDDGHKKMIALMRQRIDSLAVDFTRLTPHLARDESVGLAREFVELAAVRCDLLKLALPWDEERQQLAEAVDEAAVAALALLPNSDSSSDAEVDRLWGRATFYSVSAKTDLGLVCGDKLDPIGASHFLNAIALCLTRSVWAERHDLGDIAAGWLLLAASIYNRMSNDRNWPASVTWRNALSLAERAIECAATDDGRELARAKAANYASLLADSEASPEYARLAEGYKVTGSGFGASTLPLW